MATERSYSQLDTRIAALIRQLAVGYRGVSKSGSDEAFAAFCEAANDAIYDARPSRSGNDRIRNNVHYWLTQARGSAYCLSRDFRGNGYSRPRADFATVLYGLSMARRELKKGKTHA